MKKLVCLLAVVSVMGGAQAAISNFDGLTFDGEADYWNDAGGAGGFSDGDASYETYNDGAGYWDGFAYSKRTETTSTGLAGQFSAIAGGAHSGSNYGIGYVGFYGRTPTITLTSATQISSIFVTNTNYAYDAMLSGDTFSKKFETGDWFKLFITGKDASGASTGTVEFLLADGTNIVDEWTEVDLSSLRTVTSMEFVLDSSDHYIDGAGNDWGMNTPAYFAIDTIVPEPTTLALLCIGALMIRRKN